MSDQPDPDATIPRPPVGPPDLTERLPATEPSGDAGEATAAATVIDTGASAATIGAPPAAPMAPPPAPPTIAPFPTAAPEPAAAGFGGAPATPVVPVTSPPKRSGGRALPWVLAAVFAVAAVGLGIWGFGQQGNVGDRDDTIDQLRSQNDDLDAQLTALQEGQDSVQEGLDQASATASSLATELATAQSDLATAQSDLAARQADLDTATAQIADLEAQLSAATSTTLPPEPEPTDPTVDDGIISEDEFAAVTQAFGSIIPPGFTIEQAQDIANQACAASDTDSLQTALENITQMYIPSGNPVDAGLVTGGIAGLACSTHIQSLTGG